MYDLVYNMTLGSCAIPPSHSSHFPQFIYIHYEFKSTNRIGGMFYEYCHIDTIATPRVHPQKFEFKATPA
jgi:hypothetical protein